MKYDHDYYIKHKDVSRRANRKYYLKIRVLKLENEIYEYIRLLFS